MTLLVPEKAWRGEAGKWGTVGGLDRTLYIKNFVDLASWKDT